MPTVYVFHYYQTHACNQDGDKMTKKCVFDHFDTVPQMVKISTISQMGYCSVLCIYGVLSVSMNIRHDHGPKTQLSHDIRS